MGVANEWKIIEDPSATTEQVLGQRVKALRLVRGWTQAQLAEVLTEEGLSFSQGTVAKLEGAKRPTTITELVALARIFNQEPKDLLINYEIPEGLFEYSEADREDRAATQNLRDAVWRFIAAKQRLADAADYIHGRGVVDPKYIARSILVTPDEIVREVRESKAEVLEYVAKRSGLDSGLGEREAALLQSFIESSEGDQNLRELWKDVYGVDQETS